MSRQAINFPVSTGTIEIHSDDITATQHATVDLEARAEANKIARTAVRLPSHTLIVKDKNDVVLVPPTELSAAYIDELSFNEEPIRVRIERSQEKYAPHTVDCWVNGKGAEVFTDGKWLTLGFLPVNKPIVTRRKYVEVLVRARQDNIRTRDMDEMLQDRNSINACDISTSMKYPVAIIEDRNPLGTKWFQELVGEQA